MDVGYRLQGWEGVISGELPRGAGLSLSAAIQLATARAFEAVSGFPLGCRGHGPGWATVPAENRWVGVNCGIMDQMISAAGLAGHALLIDCRSLDFELAPLPSGTAVAHSGHLRGHPPRPLADLAYNERRAQCEAAAVSSACRPCAM